MTQFHRGIGGKALNSPNTDPINAKLLRALSAAQQRLLFRPRC
jgi:hypothetical protein